jgi:hypothetical protein
MILPSLQSFVQGSGRQRLCSAPLSTPSGDAMVGTMRRGS